MRTTVVSKEMPKPEKPIFFLHLQAETDVDKASLEKIVFDSKDGFNYNPGTQIKGPGDRILSLTLQLTRRTF